MLFLLKLCSWTLPVCFYATEGVLWSMQWDFLQIRFTDGNAIGCQVCTNFQYFRDLLVCFAQVLWLQTICLFLCHSEHLVELAVRLQLRFVTDGNAWACWNCYHFNFFFLFLWFISLALFLWFRYGIAHYLLVFMPLWLFRRAWDEIHKLGSLLMDMLVNVRIQLIFMHTICFCLFFYATWDCLEELAMVAYNLGW